MPSLASERAGATLADGKLTLTGVAELDRLRRPAGARRRPRRTAQFVEQWDEGEDQFDIDPPNATVSVLGGADGVSDAVVTLGAQCSTATR